MTDKIILEWGHTPWDELEKDDLLREIQRMWAAMIALNSCLRQMRANDSFRAGIDPDVDPSLHPYWGPNGSGGRALEMARQVIGPVKEKYDYDSVYKSFFRYTTDLLFDRSAGYRIGFGWAVCPKCGVMLGESPDEKSVIGEKCSDHLPTDGQCDGIFRAITWDDMSPDVAE